MKKNVILIGIVLGLAFGSGAYAQLGFRTGLKIGTNWSTVSDDSLTDIGWRNALTGGICLEFNFPWKLAIEAAAIYSPRGAVSSNRGELNLNYISVPVVLKKKFLPALIHPYILAGLEWNFLISAEEDGSDIKDELKAQYFCLQGGLGLEVTVLGKGAFIEGRYTHGFTDVWEGDDRSIKNNVLAVFIGILL